VKFQISVKPKGEKQYSLLGFANYNYKCKLDKELLVKFPKVSKPYRHILQTCRWLTEESAYINKEIKSKNCTILVERVES